MNFREFGLILFVEEYEKCIKFYRDVLKLSIRNIKESLVAFDLPNGYLMVEKGGVGSVQEKQREQNPTVLRFDVESLDTEVKRLEKNGVLFMHKNLEFDWGAISVFKDPDGNRIELGEINTSSGSYTSN
ncbi:glyoxalase/bleomycin resistance/dioxygenase family protein [Halalkalibacillus sediminis]|uniref:Glyoxalase/bleomycin resistance/dioxygenase family protein n=1 Tax=Halalkalibacillus sediminis TaxID=2018042 RepID=A0A2I0QSN8_9BACI|nr:VOC family protein [Halalkalibacillus sediminis]PKR77353.1 glyoxalase/bleomycin resistance/dioxygenase family protein [Halalkalibacillus sediminis]